MPTLTRTRAILAASALLAAAAALPLALSRPAQAGPRALDDAGLGRVAAGFLDTYVVMPVVLVRNDNASTAGAVGSRGVASGAASDVTVNSVVVLAPADALAAALPAAALAALPAAGAAAAPAAGGAARGAAPSPQAPVWVPWAAELRGSLGLR